MKNINVKALVRLIGINENTLRGWERRYAAVTPERDSEGRRVYSAKDIERIKLLWSLVKEGHSIGRIANLATPQLKKMLATTISPEMPVINASAPKTEAYLNDIIQALEKFNMEKLVQILMRVRFEMSTKEIIINLVQPLMVRVGQLIFDGRLSITQEHILSSLLRDYLGNIYLSLSPYDFSSRQFNKSVILTTREGDIHEFGIFLSAILCNLYRFRTYYLGPNMPLNDLTEAVEQFKADFVIVGLTKLPKEREIVSASEFIGKLDRSIARKVSLCLGGSQTLDLSNMSTERTLLQFSGLYELDQFLSQQSR